jgi:VanZ family protein
MQTPRTILKLPLNRQLFCWLVVCALVFNLFYLGSKPVAVGLFAAPWDKLAHFTVFSVITALLWMGTRKRHPISVILAVALIGGLDEVHQSTLPGREADIWDFLTDAAAAALTTYLLHRFGRSAPVDRNISRH